jgi:hypothetical protein
VPLKKKKPGSRGNRLPAVKRGWLFGDPVGPGVADPLADYGDAVLLRQGPARAHEGTRRVHLPAELLTDLFQGRAIPGA